MGRVTLDRGGATLCDLDRVGAEADGYLTVSVDTARLAARPLLGAASGGAGGLDGYLTVSVDLARLGALPLLGADSDGTEDFARLALAFLLARCCSSAASKITFANFSSSFFTAESSLERAFLDVS
jgi:hypothetical protein